MTIPTAPPPAPDAAPSAATVHPSERFFLWVGGLGIARSEGWIGGVCAGIAARLRIDPLIVRGVFVVAALFGLPIVFLYAVAWALLPDADGRIHTRDVLRRDFQPVQLGILITALIGLIPSAPVVGGWLAGFWYNPYDYERFNSSDWSPLSVLGWLIGLALVGALLFLIVRAARHTPGAAASHPSMASTDETAPDASAPVDGSGTVNGPDAMEPDAGALADSAAPASALLETHPTALALTAPKEPAALSGAAQTPEEIEEWRAQHAAWKEQDQAWRQQQQDAERAARDQARRERQQVAAVFAAEAAERRRVRRATNPRASFALVASVIGLSLVAGAAAGLLTGGGDERLGLAVGLLSAALVLALGMVATGAFRRRSGFLAFLTVIVLLGGALATGTAALRELTFGDASLTNTSSAHVQQAFGSLSIDLNPHEGAPRPITVVKGTGNTFITVAEGVELLLHATVDDVPITWTRFNTRNGEVLDSGEWTAGSAGAGEQFISENISSERTPISTKQQVIIDQAAGEIHIMIESEDGEE